MRPKGRQIKLKNRRVYVWKDNGGYQMLFKRLADKNEDGKIVKTALTLSDEAMGAVFQLVMELNDVDIIKKL